MNKTFHFENEHEAYLALHRVQELGYGGEVIGDAGGGYPSSIVGGVQLLVFDQPESDGFDGEPELPRSAFSKLENLRLLLFFMLIGIGFAICFGALLPVVLLAGAIGILFVPVVSGIGDSGSARSRQVMSVLKVLVTVLLVILMLSGCEFLEREDFRGYLQHFFHADESDQHGQAGNMIAL